MSQKKVKRVTKKKVVTEVNLPTPLIMKKLESTVIAMSVDYVKALLDYKVEYSLPDMSPKDMTKMINFFIHNDVVVENRPPLLNIKIIDTAVYNAETGFIHFNIHLNSGLSDGIDTVNFFNLFHPYFDLWMQKFVIVYGKYLTAADAGKLDELLKS